MKKTTILIKYLIIILLNFFIIEILSRTFILGVTADPNAFSYNVYRENPQGGFSQIASNLSYTNYLDAPLGYSENYRYSYSFYTMELVQVQ